MLLENQILSKVLDENNFLALTKNNLNENDFNATRNVYEFIKDYYYEYDSVPDYRTVITKFDNFEYIPEVSDQFTYLCKTLRKSNIKRQSYTLLQNKVTENFKNMDGEAFAEWLLEEATILNHNAKAKNNLGTNIAKNGIERKEWYRDNQEKRTYSYIPTPYPSLTNWLGGGFELGDYILLMSFTNRGKSWLGGQIGQTAWRNDFMVIHYSPELTKKQQTYRFDTIDGHFNNVDLRRGNLENEKEYLEYLDQFNDEVNTNYIVKTMEDLPEGLTLEIIENDLRQYPETKMVIIDGFNLMVHGKGNNLRDNMTKTSRQLRQMFGRHGVVGVVIHQTNGASEKNKITVDEEGYKIVQPPKITDYSETIALVQDPSTILTFDQADGIGKISIEKAREPNVGKVVELHCNFNHGYITEVEPENETDRF